MKDRDKKFSFGISINYILKYIKLEKNVIILNSGNISQV